MRYPGYREAIEWLAANDDCYWLGDSDASGPILSVTASLVRDLFDISDDKLVADLIKALRRRSPNHPVLKHL